MKKSKSENFSVESKRRGFDVILISAAITMMAIIAGAAAAADTKTDTEGTAQTLIQAATGQRDLKWSHVFGDQPGKDLYFMIYKQILVDPDKEVEKQSAAQNGMSEQDIRSILTGDITPILARNPGLPVDKAFERLEQMRGQHNELLAVTSLKKELEAEVQPSEMFANGSTSDSGFDLLTDLYRIEKILFDESIPVDVGGNQLGNETGVAGRTPIDKSDATTESGTGGGSGTGDGSAASEKKVGSAASDGAINPEICLVGNELDKALDNLDKNAESDPRLRNQPPEGIKFAAGEGVDGAEAVDGGVGAARAPKADEWKNPEFCNGVLCIEIEAKFKQAVAIPPKSDCVSCHIKAINKTMKDLLSKSLLPSKVTGNLGEPAKCKAAASAAFTSVNMNVIVIGAPVKDPGNNDLIVGKPITDQWQQFADRYAPGSGKTTAKQQEIDLKQPTQTVKDKVANKVSADATAEADLIKIYEEVNRTLTRIEDGRQKALNDLVTSGKIDSATRHFQALNYELATMISYFSSYKKLFEEIEESCKVLASKEECK